MKKIYILLFCLFYSNSDLFSVKKGSNTVLSLETHATFLAADTDNEMLAFGWFKNGFTLEDSTTSCTFSSVFPIGGTVELNGGNLYLNNDLNFSNDTSFDSFGNIYANGYTVEYDSDNNYFADPSNIGLMDNIDLVTCSDLTLVGTLRFDGDCSFFGHGRRITLSDKSCIVVGPNSTLVVQDIALNGVNNSNIRCLDDSGKIILDNVRWIQDGNFSFTRGSLEFLNKVDFSGTYTFFFDSSLSMTINSGSEFNINKNFTLAIGTQSDVCRNDSIWLEDESSYLSFDDSLWLIGSQGLQLTRGTFCICGSVGLDVDSTSTLNGLMLGNGSEDGDVIIFCNPASLINFGKGHVTYDITKPDAFKSLSTYARIYRSADNVFNLKQDVLFKNISLKFDPGALSIVNENVDLRYEGSKLSLDGVKISMTARRYNDYTFWLDGDKSIFIEEGVLPLYILAQNSGNILRGSGSISGGIVVQPEDSELSFNLQGVVLNDITLDNGKVILENDLELGHGNFILGNGVVDLDGSDLTLGTKDLHCTSTMYWSGDYGSMDIKSNVFLSGSWTFSGNCTINAFDNILELGRTGRIKVEKGSTLKIKNTKVTNVSSGEIICLGNDSKIILDNVKWIQDGDYTFSTGSLEVLNKVDLNGTCTFYYDSNNQLLINKNSTLKINKNSILAIGTNSDECKNDAILFENLSSKLWFKDSLLVIGSNGLQIKKGTIIVDGSLEMTMYSTSTQNGLILGDGTAENDMELYVNAASVIKFGVGHMTYDTTKPDGMKSLSTYGKIIRKSGNVFCTKQDFLLEDISIKYESGALSVVMDGVSLNYKNCAISLDGVKFTMDAQRYNDYTFLLGGDQNVFIKEGTFPLAIVAVGEGNDLSGNGNLSGPIFVQGNSELDFNIYGSVLYGITLIGGSMNLNGDLEFGPSAAIQGSGVVRLGNNDIFLGTQDLMWTSTVYWDSNGGIIDLNSNIYLTSKWTFSGNTMLNCKNNMIIIQPTGSIDIERGSTLTFKNMRLGGLFGTNMQCLDDSGTIVFNGGKSKIFGDYSFEKGRFMVTDDFEIRGDYIFSYNSSQQSVIGKCSLFSLYPGITFSYNPPTDNRDLIKLSCESEFCMDDATLHSTTTGMRFRCGVFRVSGDCCIESDATIKSEGVTFGDGVNVENDTMIDILPNGTLELRSGYLVYKNLA